MAHVLVVDDERGIRSFLCQVLEMDGHVTAEAANAGAALERLAHRGFDLVFTDLRMPDSDGMHLVRTIRELYPDTEVIVLTAHGTITGAVDAMRMGAFDFVQKPLDSIDGVRLLAARALERRQLLTARERAALDEPGIDPLFYRDPEMARIAAMLRKVAAVDSTVLLQGESGTGKELAARSVHQWSRRADQPFVAVNCAALPENLIEVELFGCERGAFTGATERRRGRIELAHGGTLLLDEIGELKPALQAKLLRVLETRELERVGGQQAIACDVRWIAATNRDLEARIEAGEFRADLYHRLAVFPVTLPPLRGRPLDILPVARRLLERIVRSQGRRPLHLHPEAEALLEDYTWPGNIRQLANVIERAAILCDGETITAADILIDLRPAAPSLPAAPNSPNSLAAAERGAILRALESADWNRRRAAEILGIGVRTLYDKVRLYDLDREARGGNGNT